MRVFVTVIAIIIGSLLCPASNAATPAASTYKCSPGDPDASRFWVSMDSTGFAIPWFCKNGTGWDVAGFVGHWDELDGDWIQQAAELMQSTKEQRKAVWDARANKQPTNTNYDSLRVMYRTIVAEQRASYPAPSQIPPAPVVVWVVKPESSTKIGDRPVYPLKQDGTRNTAAVKNVRALGNTPCDVAKHKDGDYYNVPSLGEVYAVCAIKKP